MSPTAPTCWKTCLGFGLTVGFFLLTTWVFAGTFWSNPDQRRTIGDDVFQEAPARLGPDDTDEYLRRLDAAAAALRAGDKFYTVSEFDIPLTYLFAGGMAMNATGCGAIEAHNVFFVIVFFLNGLAAFLFLRDFLRDTRLALLGGLVYQTANYVFAQHFLGHMNQVQLFYIPLAFLCTYRLVLGKPGIGWSMGLGVTMGLQVMSSPYYTLFLGTVALPVFALSLWLTHARARQPITKPLALAGHLALAVGVAVAVSGFYILDRIGAPAEVFPITAPLWRGFNLDDPLELLKPTHGFLFIGLPLFALSVLATRWVFARPDPKWTATGVTTALSLGMMMPPVPAMPYWFFYHLVPMADRLRVPERFFPIFLLMLFALVSGYLQHEMQGRKRWLRVALFTGFCASIMLCNWLPSPWASGGVDYAVLARKLLLNRD